MNRPLIRGAVAVPALSSNNLQEVVRLLKQNVDSMTGQLDPLARVVTVGDAPGIETSFAGGASGGGGGGGVITVPGGGAAYDPYADLTTPPAPTGLTATGGYSYVLLNWDPEPAIYKNPAYAEIYVNTTNNLGTATLLTRTTGNVLSHELGAGATRYYWIRYVSLANVTGPYNATPGVSATTAINVSAVLAALNGQITASQLASSLSTRIDLIDTAGTGLVDRVGDLETTYGSTASAATSAAAAAASAAAAATAEANAIIAQGGAANSATNASNSATSAATQATNAAGSASSAATSATTASTAATNASNSSSAAATSASNAATSATNSANSATASQTARVAAETARDNALGSATAAATSASTATTKATEAATSATAASTSATTATTKAAEAAASATSAASSSTTAAGYANSSAVYATQAQAIVNRGYLGLPLSLWTLNGQTLATVSDGKVGNQVLRLAPLIAGYPYQPNYIPIDRTKKYRIRFWARPVGSPNGYLLFGLRQYSDDVGTMAPINSGLSVYKPYFQTLSGHNTQFGAGQWGEYSYIWDNADWQAETKYVRPTFLDNYNGSTGSWEIQDFYFAEVTDTETLYAAVSTESSARASADGALQAQYTVKVDVNGYVSGFGLASTANNTGDASSEFLVKANRFAFGAPGQSTKYPFVIVASPTTINGQAVPAGVYMDAAFIENGTIEGVKIGHASIDSAHIVSVIADRIATGVLQASVSVGSSNYSSGVAGWQILGNGTAEFNNITVRGTVYASAGTFAGSLSGATGTFSGALSAATGTFAGSLSAADGTLGQLTITSTGHIKLGKTSFADMTAGLWQGMDGGDPKFHYGNSTSWIKWSPSGGLELSGAKLDSFTASISPTSLYTDTTNGDNKHYGNATVSASGGRSPYTYQWLIASDELEPTGTPGYVAGPSHMVISGTGGVTAGFYGSGSEVIHNIIARCIVTDANGRSAVATIEVTGVNGTIP